MTQGPRETASRTSQDVSSSLLCCSTVRTPPPTTDSGGSDTWRCSLSSCPVCLYVCMPVIMRGQSSMAAAGGGLHLQAGQASPTVAPFTTTGRQRRWMLFSALLPPKASGSTPAHYWTPSPTGRVRGLMLRCIMPALAYIRYTGPLQQALAGDRQPSNGQGSAGNRHIRFGDTVRPS